MNVPNNELNNRKSIFDDIVSIKREQIIAKKEFTNPFLHKIEDWFERCFLRSKEKKEFLVTKEKLILELLQLVQSQKKFKDSDLIHNQICALSVFDIETNLMGKILSINFQNNTVEFITMASCKNNNEIVNKKLNEVDLFDPFSVKMEVYYKLQKRFYDCYNYKDTFVLLTGKEIKEDVKDNNKEYIQYSLGRGIKLDKRIQERINNADLKDE